MNQNKIKVLPAYLYEGEIWRHNNSDAMIQVSKTEDGTFLTPLSRNPVRIADGTTITYVGMPVPEGETPPEDRKKGMSIHVCLEP